MQIKLKTMGLYAENKLLCDGAYSEVISTRQCLIPMKYLRSLPYGYILQDMPQFVIRARNIRGWGALSSPNSIGALIETEPLIAPTLTRDVSTTD
jgi:hypothetical protein